MTLIAVEVRSVLLRAAYGSPLEPQVQVLRKFRDCYLLTHAMGRQVSLHYLIQAMTLFFSVRMPHSVASGQEVVLA